MRLFLDTEFSDLIPGNKLISIALVDENENFFYAELTDTYEVSDCSDFCKAYVLPFLKGGDYRMTRIECARRLGNWIEDRNALCYIANDNPSWDLPHLERLLEDAFPKNLDLESGIYPIHITDLDVEEMVVKYDYDIHCALDDALIMKKVTLGY